MDPKINVKMTHFSNHAGVKGCTDEMDPTKFPKYVQIFAELPFKNSQFNKFENQYSFYN